MDQIEMKVNGLSDIDRFWNQESRFYNRDNPKYRIKERDNNNGQ